MKKVGNNVKPKRNKRAWEKQQKNREKQIGDRYLETRILTKTEASAEESEREGYTIENNITYSN